MVEEITAHATAKLQYWIITMEAMQVVTFFIFTYFLWLARVKILPEAHEALVAIADTLYDKSKFYAGHCRRVSVICSAICDSMGIRGEERRNIITAGMLHDLGKIYIDEDILHKPEKLTDAEWEIVKMHTVKGASVLRKFGVNPDITSAVLYHHENWDGTGYPLQIDGENIPLAARIIRVADSIDAMAMGRPYKKGMLFDEINQDLKDHSGTWYDESIIKYTTNGLAKRIKLIILNHK